MVPEIEPVEPKGIYALRVKSSTDSLGLNLNMYSYSKILESLERGANVFEACARITGTKSYEQLKFVLVSNGPIEKYPDTQAAICVVPSSESIDFKKLPKILLEEKFYKSIRDKKFSPSRADAALLGLAPEYIGFCDNLHFPQFTDPSTPPFLHPNDEVPFLDDIHSEEKIPYIIDESVKGLLAICAPLGKGRTDELGVISGKGEIGFYTERLFEGIIGKKAFALGNIRKADKPNYLGAMQLILCTY